MEFRYAERQPTTIRESKPSRRAPDRLEQRIAEIERTLQLLTVAVDVAHDEIRLRDLLTS